jgi:hypothetical protein
MEAIDRIIVSKDWITILLLLIVFLIVIAHFVNQKRLQRILSLPFNKLYLLNYTCQPSHFFNILFFTISSFTYSLFIYLLLKNSSFEGLSDAPISYIEVLVLIVLFWVFNFFLGLFIAYLFEIVSIYRRVVFVKKSYYFSGSLYVLMLMIIYIYFFNSTGVFFSFVLVLFSILLLLRYIHFIITFQKQISSHLFYYILYLCALEIAPLLIAVKIGL